MKTLICLLIITAGMTSCVHVYYAPNTPNAPLLSQKGETRINALYASGGNLSSFQGGEIQLAHAVSKNIGIMANGLAGGRTETVSSWNGNRNDHEESGHGSYGEFGAGYFKGLDNRQKWIAELYGGFGFGSVKNDYGSGDHSTVNHSKLFLQPSVGYKIKNFEAVLVPRLSYIKWKVKDCHAMNNDNEYVQHDMNAIRSRPNFISFEPALLLRAGGEDFKIQGGLSFSNYRSTSHYFSDELIETLNASIGISINLKPKKK